MGKAQFMCQQALSRCHEANVRALFPLSALFPVFHLAASSRFANLGFVGISTAAIAECEVEPIRATPQRIGWA